MSIKKGLLIFIFLSIAVSGSLLFFSFDTSALVVFKQAHKERLVLAGLMVVAVWLFDALKFKLLTTAAGEQISFRLSLELIWINYFGSALTPMQSGGGPFQMYLMYKNNISLGKTVAITLVRTFLTILILALAIPFAFMFLPDLPKLGVDMKAFIYYIAIFSVVVLTGVVVSLVRPKIIKRLFGKIVIGLKRIGFVRPERVIRMLKRVLREIDIYHKNVWAFITTGRKFFLLGSLTAIVQMCVQLSVMPCMIWALGIPVAYVECVLVQALFIFMLYFIPTPGGSGAAELGAAFVFNIFVPWNLAGMLGVVWRVLTEYTGIVLGGIVALKLIGWDLANQIMTEKKQNVDEVDSEECSNSEDSDL